MQWCSCGAVVSRCMYECARVDGSLGSPHENGTCARSLRLATESSFTIDVKALVVLSDLLVVARGGMSESVAEVLSNFYHCWFA